jgi:hypothetical protein
MFISVPGLDYAGPELLDQLQNIAAAVQRVLSRYEATLLEIGADDKGIELITVFGLPPFAHEDDASRGPRAALDIQSTFAKLRVSPEIGIATGRMFCGPIGNSRRRQYTLYGDEMNTAARFMQAARYLGDGIYCDEATYHSAKGLLNFHKLPPLVLKGKAEPMRVLRLAAPTSNNKLRPPLLGRQAERTVLAQSLQDLCDGKGTVVFIEGEPGIGKSRLLQDLLESASQRGLRSLSAGTEALEKLTPYYVWRGIVSQLLGIAELTELAERRLLVNSKLAGADTTCALAPLLNTLLAVDLPENEVTSQMTGELRADSLNQLLLDLVRPEAEQTPLLIVLEDAHWMDSASWALTLRLAL